MARVAVLGGSFNPIHYGHLLLADDVLEQLVLDRVLFVPAGSPPHKLATLLAPAAHRYEMVRRAIADHPRFDVSDVELRRSFNHRFGLDDAMLIKDNHIAVAGGIRAVLERAKAAAGHLVKIEIEVDTLDQLREVLEVGLADAVLLDNMDAATMRKAVQMVGGKFALEASGGITLDTIAEIAKTGVDYASSGWITHSAPHLDVALDIEM